MKFINFSQRFLILTASLLNFSSFAADEKALEEPLNQSLEKIIEEDAAHIDRVLKDITGLLDLNYGGIDRLNLAGTLLTQLIGAHRQHALSSPTRRHEIDNIGQATQEFLTAKSQSEEDRLLDDPSSLQGQIGQLGFEPTVAEFLIDYLIKQPRIYKSLTAQISCACIIGASFGPGCTMAIDLSGRRWVGPCLSAGLATWLGADIAVEWFEREDWFSKSRRFHWVRCGGIVREIASTEGPWHRELLFFKSAPVIRGWAIGHGEMSEYSAQLSAAVLRIPGRDYSFARKRLGIIYPES